MARYTAEQIYVFARKAGFSPDQAATMTAISLAESGGNSRAHNPHGEDSRGLWQINADAHPELARRYDLFDPAQNAQAAFAVSQQGTDISPWTVAHGGASARYLRHREAAQAAAVSYGDGSGRGMWNGTTGYGSVVGAGAGTSADPAVAAGGGASALSPDSPTQRFLSTALAQAGDRYIFGAEVRMDDADPDAFDCSELVEYAASKAGVTVPDGASAQYLWAKERGLLIDPEEAARTPGALLFSFSTEPQPGGGRPSSAHVAISLGDGTTIEARGRRYGVGSWDVGERFTYAAVIPGISDAASLAAAGRLDVAVGDTTGAAVAPAAVAAAPLAAPAVLDLGGDDTDADGLTDRKEQVAGLDPLSADTDQDTLPDGWELIEGSDARRADADGDLLPDNFEFAQGLDPLDPDTDDDGHLDGALQETWVDTDGDGVDDALETLLGLDPLRADTDADGFVDGLEYRSGSEADDRLSVPVTSAADLLADDAAP